METDDQRRTREWNEIHRLEQRWREEGVPVVRAAVTPSKRAKPAGSGSGWSPVTALAAAARKSIRKRGGVARAKPNSTSGNGGATA
jgi:hypothetical protein